MCKIRETVLHKCRVSVCARDICTIYFFIFHNKKDGSGCKVIYEGFLIYEEIGKYLVIFNSLLTSGGSFAKNLNLLAQKEKNNILHWRHDLTWIEEGYVQYLEDVEVF
jgi:hypothetical protein